MSGVEALLALADRCEKADGPDRYLDYDIALAVLPHLEKIPATKWMYEVTGAKHVMFTVMFDDGDRRYTYSAETYTSSIDAAMTLWGEKFHGQITILGTRAKAYIWTRYPAATEVIAATPALAATAVALRSLAARAQQEPSA